MKTVKEKRRYFLKRLGITLVIPLFLMVIGSIMMLVPFWGLVSQAMTFSSVIFYDPNLEITHTSFQINDHTMYLPKIGDEFATLNIPSADLSVSIYQGEGNEQLRKGVGHYVGSLLPGEGGNVVLSGHRETAFYALKDLVVGDKVYVETDYGTYEYEVSDIYITTPDDVSATMPTDTEKLTMYTCYPFIKYGPTPERYIVVSDFIQLK